LIKPINRKQTLEAPGRDPVFPPLAGWANGGMGSGKHLGLKFDHLFDYSYDGIMRCYEDSLQRLGMNAVDVLVIHDLDRGHFNHAQIDHHLSQLTQGGWRALETLKASGEIKAFGAGVNHVGTMSQFMDVMELDFFLVSQIYSLMHHGNLTTFGLPTMLDNPYPGERNLNDHEGGALAEFNRVQERGMGVIAATVYNSGLMIKGSADGEEAVCNYRTITPPELTKVRAIEAVCAEFDVPLPAAALQFPLAHPVVVRCSCVCVFLEAG
jgi:D-threo-aldose 1-dehydrogenase